MTKMIGLAFLAGLLATHTVSAAESTNSAANNNIPAIALPDAAPAAEQPVVPAVAAPSPKVTPAATIPAVPNEPTATGDAASLVKEAAALEAKESLSDAREKYQAALPLSTNALRKQIEDSIGSLNLSMITSLRPMPEKVEYTVKPGDSLGGIAKAFGTTKELIKTNNMIRKNLQVNVGDRYRIFTGKFEVVVNKTRNDLVLTLNNRFFKRYDVGTGKFGKTPSGTFVIQDRLMEPPWWRPDGKVVPFGDKENILGTRWLALKATGTTEDVRGYGIHGTWDNSTIGKQESSGCIRLRNEDVEELYMLLPVGTPVKIEE